MPIFLFGKGVVVYVGLVVVISGLEGVAVKGAYDRAKVCYAVGSSTVLYVDRRRTLCILL